MNTIRLDMLPPTAAPPRLTRPTQLRWNIWNEQRCVGHEPCFGTEQRLFCEELNCHWRGTCLSLRAEWRR